MKKFHFTFDNNKKNKILEKRLLNKYKNYSPKSCDVIVVLGGDGFMLQTLKKYQKYDKPFYGVNRGTFGFLMNKFKSYNINKNFWKTQYVNQTWKNIKLSVSFKKLLCGLVLYK